MECGSSSKPKRCFIGREVRVLVVLVFEDILNETTYLEKGT